MDKLKPAPKQRKILQAFRVDPDTWERFKAQCERQNIEPSAAVRQLVEQAAS